MPTFLVPPSPSSAVDMHKLTLKAAQNQLAIKKLEEKNEQLQKEIEALRQDMELLKKLVVSLDLHNLDGLASALAPAGPSTAQTPEDQEKSKRKTVAVTKVNSEKTIPKTSTKDRKSKAPVNSAPKDDDELSAKKAKRESEKQTVKQDKPSSGTKGTKKSTKKSQ